MPPIHDACARPLGGVGRSPFSPSPGTFGSTASTCDLSYNRTYPKNAADAWTAIVMVMTSFTQLARFVEMGNYATWTQQVLEHKNIIPIIFYPTAEPWFRQHETAWQTKAFGARRCAAPNDVVAGTRCARWVNHKQQTLLTCPVDMAVPLMYNGNLHASRSIKLPTFCGRGLFNGEYVVVRPRGLQLSLQLWRRRLQKFSQP